MVLASLALLFTVGVGTMRAHPPGELVVDVLETREPSCGGSICRLAVRVENRGDHAVEPRFSVRHGHWQPLPWSIRQGPSTLSPGRVQLYVIGADSNAAMIGMERDFFVVAFDGLDAQQLERSPLVRWASLREAERLRSAGDEALAAGGAAIAIGHYLGAIELHPPLASAYVGLALAYHRDGKTNEVTGRFFRPRVSEEFYDNETDFDNVRNLIDKPEHQAKKGF